MPDDTELGQRIAHGKALDDFSDKFRVVAEDVRVLFEDGRADPRLDQTGACELVDECLGIVLGREGRELQNAGVKDDSHGRAWRLGLVELLQAMPVALALLTDAELRFLARGLRTGVDDVPRHVRPFGPASQPPVHWLRSRRRVSHQGSEMTIEMRQHD